jgi:hypothetical protein
LPDHVTGDLKTLGTDRLKFLDIDISPVFSKNVQMKSLRDRLEIWSKEPLYPDETQVQVDVILAKTLYPAWVG